MDINTLVKKLDISTFKVAWLSLFDRSALIDYLVNKANTAVNSLLTDNKTHLSAIRAAMLEVNGFLYRYHKLIYPAWLPYVERVNAALKRVYEATEDYTIDSTEAKAAISWFKEKYSEYMAD